MVEKVVSEQNRPYLVSHMILLSSLSHMVAGACHQMVVVS